MPSFVTWSLLPISFTSFSCIIDGSINYLTSLTINDITMASITCLDTEINKLALTWGYIGDGTNWVKVSIIAIGI